MYDSKPLKSFPRKERSRLYLWWIQSPVGDLYYDLVHRFIENPIFQVKRLLQWYWNVFRHDYDFDGHSLYAIIEYKLKRLEKCLLNGYAVQEDSHMHALRLAIKLAGRLKLDRYEEPFLNRHDRKWGESKTWMEDTGRGNGSSYFRSSRPNAVTQEQKDQESKEYLACMHGAYAKQLREQSWFYGILSKYLNRLWD